MGKLQVAIAALATALVLLVATPSDATVTVVNTTLNCEVLTNNACTIPAATAGNVLFISGVSDGCTSYSITGGSVIDSVLGSCVFDGYILTSGGETSVTVNNGHTGTLDDYYNVLEISGLSTISLVDKHTMPGATNASSCTSSALTPTASGEYYIAMTYLQVGFTVSANSTSPVTSDTLYVGTQPSFFREQDFVANYGSASAITASWTFSGSSGNACGAVLLNPSGGGGGGGGFPINPANSVQPGGGPYGFAPYDRLLGRAA